MVLPMTFHPILPISKGYHEEEIKQLEPVTS